MRRTTTSKRSTLHVSEQRVKGKLAECEFFIDRMSSAHDAQEFGHCLSAFLSALSSYVQLGLIRKNRKKAAAALDQMKQSKSRIGFLLSYRDVEVHREGVSIWSFKSSTRKMTPRFTGGLWGDLLLTTRDIPRFRSRFQSRFGDLRHALEMTPMHDTQNEKVLSFVFESSGQDVLKSCRTGLEDARALIE